MRPSMHKSRWNTLALPFYLLTGACGPDGGTGSDGTITTSTGATDTDDQTGSTVSPTDAGTTSSSTGDTTVEPVTGTDPTAATTVEPDTDTDSATDSTTGEPMPLLCADEPVPEPANELLDSVELIHFVGEGRFGLNFQAYYDDKEFDVAFDLGPDEPVVGVLQGVPFFAEQWLGRSGMSLQGTATLELVAITADCVVGRVSEVEAPAPDPEITYFVPEDLPGGFFATRVAQ